MKTYIIILFLAGLGFTSCETVVDIDVPREEPKLVVHGFFNPDSTIRVSLLQSQFVLEESKFDTVSGAKVSLFDEAGTKLAQLTERKRGVYEADMKPEAGKTYRIEASKQGYETVWSQDLIPSDAAVMSRYEITTSSGEVRDETTISIWVDDSPGKDFYELYAIYRAVEIYNYENGSDTLNYETQLYFNSDDPVFDDFAEDEHHVLFFNDALFDGKEVKISLNTFSRLNYCDVGCPEIKEEELTFYLRKVSESYYRYKRTAELQGSLGGDPFAEPVSVFNNIENGFGIFAGYRTSVYPLELPKN